MEGFISYCYNHETWEQKQDGEVLSNLNKQVLKHLLDWSLYEQL